MILAGLYSLAVWFESFLLENAEVRFSEDMTEMLYDYLLQIKNVEENL